MAQPLAASAQPAPPRLLVVEDDATVRDFCMRVLRMNGYAVATAENGRAALARLQEARFDLVLTDLQMPELTGIKLLEHMRQHHADVDAIAFTAYATVDTARQALKLGAFDYLTKPVSVEDLERTVRKCLELRRIRQEKERLSELVAMYEFSQTIASSLDTATQVQQIVRLLGQRFAPHEVSLSLLQVTDPVLELLAAFRASGNGDSALPSPQLVVLEQGDANRASSVTLARGHEREGQALLEAHLCMINAAASEGPQIAQEVLRTSDQPVGVLRLERGAEQPPFEPDERRLLAVFASQIAASLDNARLYQQLQEQNLQTVIALAKAIEARDPYTRGHSEQVTRYAVRMMELQDASPERIELMRYASLLHDIGKIGIRDDILLKPEGLNAEEFAVMRTHPQIGANILRSIRSLRDALPIVEGHHERVDGRGYPHGHTAEQLPVEARILAVCDAFEAMTSDRAYRKGMPVDIALDTLLKGSGNQWDRQLVDIFAQMIRREFHASVWHSLSC
ncbi:MAG: response regulator [Chloroflexales bacterium]|nr:response regulator [Chloroflexales bacterium]